MAENLTAVRFFHHASSGEGIVKIPSRACATARNVWSSQDVKITKIAICRVFLATLTRTSVAGQRAARMKCLRALLVRLFNAVTAAT